MKKNNNIKKSEIKNVEVKSNRRNNKVLVGTLILAGMTSVGIYAMASANENNGAGHGRNYSPERHERMEKAFESNNYDAWRKEMENNEHRGRVMDVVNKDNFSKFSQMHELRDDGKTEEADKIREELGLHGRGDRERHGRGMMRGERGEHRGENKGGHFEDKDGDGHCDHLYEK